MAYPTIGTNPTPYYVGTKDEPEVVKTETGYFFVQVFGAQAAFTAGWRQGADRVAVMSQVNLHLEDKHELGNQDLRGILQYRELSKNHAVQLGFSPMLIEFVPAKMKRVSISIEYLVDTKDYLKALVSLINDKDLLAPLSLAPGAAIAAKTVGGLAQKLVASLVPQKDRKPILQFSGDFDLVDEGLKEGYYVILGSHTSSNPLPSTPPKLQVIDGGGLLIDGQPVTQLSYVILRVGCVKAIRDHYGRAPWRDKFREAKQVVQDYFDDLVADPKGEKMEQMWKQECLPLLREARALLQADPNFLDSEIDLVYDAARKECANKIMDKGVTRSAAKGSTGFWQPNDQADRAFLGIKASEDADNRLNQYAEDLFAARQTFKMMQIT